MVYPDTITISGLSKTVVNVDQSYDPLKHRNLKKPVSDGRSLANLMKSSLGSGILAMPLAFKNAGIIPGIFGTIIIGFICTHCSKILVQTSRDVCKIIKVPSLGYSETCEKAVEVGPKCLKKYSKGVRFVTDGMMAFTYLGACCVYVVLMANSIKQLIDNSFPEYNLNVESYCGTLLIPLILMVQVRHLNYLAIFSAIANVLFVAVVGISMYYVFSDLPPIAERDLFANSILTLPSFISTVIFAIEGIGIVMHVENTMANPSHFLGCPGVLNICMIFIVFLYGVQGFAGYWKYGNDALGSITLNLPLNSLGAELAKIFISLAIFFTYALQFYITIEIFIKYLNWKGYSQVLLRTLCVIFTVILGVAIPKLDAIIELVGALFYTTLGIFIPAAVETIFSLNRKSDYRRWIILKNFVLMLFSVVALACGATQAVFNILK